MAKTLANTQTLVQGAKGENVKLMQQKLTDLGPEYGLGKIDGIFGNNTLQAVRKFRRDFGLGGGDYVDSKMLAVLEIAWVQKQLVSIGLDLGKFGPKKDGVDGRLGEVTKKGIRVYCILFRLNNQNDEITPELVSFMDSELKKREGILASTPKIQTPPESQIIRDIEKNSKKDVDVWTPDTTTYISKLDRKSSIKPTTICEAVREAADAMDVPAEIMLALILTENMDVSNNLNMELKHLYTTGKKLWKMGGHNEVGPTQIRPETISLVCKLKTIPNDVLNLRFANNIEDEWKFYMYATAAYIKYIVDWRESRFNEHLDLTNPEDAKKLFAYWNRGHNTSRKSSSAYANRAFDNYQIIKNDDFGRYMM